MGPGLQQTLLSIISTATERVERGDVVPALMLTYAGIDAMGWLVDKRDDPPVRDRFESWTNRYMRPALTLGCTSTELYAARCALLHTASSEATLNTKGRERRIYYAWGKASVEHLQRRISALSEHAVAVHAGQLVDTFRLGVADCLEEALADATLGTRIDNRSSAMFVGVMDIA